MTRPTPTQGAQSEARVPRVHAVTIEALCDDPPCTTTPQCTQAMARDLRDKDATIADLERRLAEANFDRRMLRDSIARVAFWNWTEKASYEATMDFSVMLKVAQVEEREDELIGFEEEVDAANARADALQARLTEAEQCATTAERRGFETGRDAAAEIVEKGWVCTALGQRQYCGPDIHELPLKIRALAPAVPQEGGDDAVTARGS